MKMKSGTTGWVILTAFVLGWDYGAGLLGGETLSSAFGRATRHPIARWPVVVAWTVTTLHLFGQLPRKIDPFHMAASTVGPKLYRN